MLTPSEVALLRQDLRTALSVVEADELDDARSLLKEHGLSESDFEFSQQAEPSPAFVSPVVGRLTCLQKSTGRSRTYAAGHASQWLTLFEADLKRGFFG